ncbi:MAG: hypothetical protein IKY27_05535 [Bacteroidales bacterium]|nr:hypothetical protein [Bacteroidales bacterium]
MANQNLNEITLVNDEFQNQSLIDFLNIAVKATSENNYTKYVSEVNKIAKSYMGLSVKASIGIGNLTYIPWISFTGYNQQTSNGIYPVLLYYSNAQILIVSYGISVTNTPKVSWNLSHTQTIGEYFKENNIPQKNAEKKYNNSFIHSVFPIRILNNEIDTSSLDVDNVLESLNYICQLYQKIFDGKLDNINDETFVNPQIYTPNEDMPINNNTFHIPTLVEAIKKTGLIYGDKLIQRYACSLMTKPFVILSGLAGSGKTQLALAFARAMSENVEQQLCVVPVGADWTNREPLLGYPNALKPGEYMQPESGALQIMMRALRNPNKPYFLVLDEMNLSYVERYFADFLSALESHQEIPLWEKPDECDSEVPAKIALPRNLFIIGTINVDETTYMFSPKVLDRANVIEFKISDKEMDKFLTQDMSVNIEAANGECANMGKDFVEKSTKKEAESSELAHQTLISFFKVLKKVNAEFGYRSATEIYRFITNAKSCANGMTDEEILDAAIVQKLLPKLHGSRKKLEPALKALWGMCMKDGHTTEAIICENLHYAKFPEAADKIQRMMQTALENGFTSFAEA